MARSDKAPRATVTGVLIVDKPVGMTSMDVVAVVRRRAGRTRTGHAGTLDPLASGVLVLGLGRATKSLAALMDTEKEYETEIDLGAFTATDDAEGEREPVAVDVPPTRAQIEAAVARFRGPIMQQPPAYSAVKVGGRRAYKLARRGETPDLAPRPVVVHAIDVRAYDWPTLTLAVRCGKGLYIRRLARDLGVALGTGGHCLSIRRTAVGPFTLAEATPLDAVPDPLGEDDLLPLATALDRLT